MKRSGFTLIELLVVIAIIALLVGILLPALGKARTSSRLAVSLSNVRQIQGATLGYRNDFKDQVPTFFGYQFDRPEGPQNPPFTAAVWFYGGKYCNTRWTAQSIYDLPPGRRPLNGYLYPDATLDRTLIASNRGRVELPAYKSPGDRGSAYDIDGTSGVFNYTITGYDDIGTSYPMNFFWWSTGRLDNTAAGWIEASRWAHRQLNLASTDPTKLVTYSDQTAPVIITDDAPVPSRRMGEFGDGNRSVMSFLDGHADYMQLERRTATPLNPYNALGFGSLVSGPNDKPFKYSFVLTQQRVR